MLVLSTLVALILISFTFATKGPITQLNVVNSDLAPDGFRRSTVVVDGQFPGPLITGQMGDRFKIRVHNGLVDNTMDRTTTIHWHGLFQKGTNYQDGASMVTQCPIVPNGSYQYDFTALNQAGTFWYHSHEKAQYCDGLRGALVVYDPQDPHADLYDIDDDTTVITLADWYHLPSTEVTIPTISNSTLINGRGRYPGGPRMPLSVVDVKPGKRYRFRLVSMSCDSYFTFSIDGHIMTVIEADGINTKPVVVDSIRIYAGQRYSVVVHANMKHGSFWIRAEQHTGPDGGPGGFDGAINSAIMRYDGSPKTDPATSQIKSVIPLKESYLQPLENPGAPGKPHKGGADVSINLEISLNGEGTGFLVNNATFSAPPMPVLLQILSGAKKAAELLPKRDVIILPRNKVVELSIPAMHAPGGPHPFHLHGHAFDVVRSEGTGEYNYANPVRRDVVSIGGNVDGTEADNVTIRFVTDNPGPWFFHCHIDWHLNAGLAVIMVEDVESIPFRDKVTPAWKDLCPEYNRFLATTQPHTSKSKHIGHHHRSAHAN